MEDADPNELPTVDADPEGYALTYTSGSKMQVLRISDGTVIGEYADRASAVIAARADRGTSTSPEDSGSGETV